MIHDAEKRRSIGFLNWAHGLDHYVLGIYPTIVIGLQAVYQRSYSELIALSTAMFVAFGVFSLPAGWLATKLGYYEAFADHSVPVLAWVHDAGAGGG